MAGALRPEALRLMGVSGAAARRAMSDAYETKRAAILASRKADWAAVMVSRPELKAYADWLSEQTGVTADLARGQRDGGVRSQAVGEGVPKPVWPAPEASKDPIVPPQPTMTASTEKAGPTVASRRPNRFVAIFDRSDAEARDDEAVRRAMHDADLIETARAERDAAIERSVVKAAIKILGVAGQSSIDDMRGSSHESERTTAVAQLRDAILDAGRRRRARRAALVPGPREIRRIQRERNSPSR